MQRYKIMGLEGHEIIGILMRIHLSDLTSQVMTFMYRKNLKVQMKEFNCLNLNISEIIDINVMIQNFVYNENEFD